MPLTFLLASAMPRGRSSVTAGMALTLLGIVWVGLPVAIAILLFQLPHGSAIIVNVLVGTFVGDTGAYLGGRAFGRRPLAPAISPSKTVEGLLIGMVAAVVGTCGSPASTRTGSRTGRPRCSAPRWRSPRRSATSSSRA